MNSSCYMPMHAQRIGNLSNWLHELALLSHISTTSVQARVIISVIPPATIRHDGWLTTAGKYLGIGMGVFVSITPVIFKVRTSPTTCD